MFAPMSSTLHLASTPRSSREIAVQCGLTTQGRQDCVRFFLSDDLLNHLGVMGSMVGGVRELGVGHDGCRVRVNEDDAYALLLSTRSA